MQRPGNVKVERDGGLTVPSTKSLAFVSARCQEMRAPQK